ncbi:rhodopsin-like protein [Brachionus plicatilis]|uniref:Rhodopsin-like protein n=1 Tax=Brachionus plicatilis TaxID=10195 RepID=A0A3M7QQ23_BRAPC|nr:rhodopsin-like protein [Brachionus plicatilis]
MNTTQIDLQNSIIFSRIVSFLPLIIIFVAITGNTACFFIFRFSKEFKNISSLVFLSFVAIFGITSQFVFNLNHFLGPNFNFRIENVSDFTCKFLVFSQYVSLQAIGNLLSAMCIDRFVTIMATPGSIYSRLPFSTVKSSYIWSFSIVAILFLTNFHILIFNGNYKKVRSTKNVTTTEIVNGTIVTRLDTVINYQVCYWYNADFRLYPTWDHVNLGLRLTISILAITFGYIIMTLPVTIIIGFFFNFFSSLPNGLSYLSMADSFGFLFHATLFINCIATNIKFRRYVIRGLACNKEEKITDTTANSISKRNFQ